METKKIGYYPGSFKPMHAGHYLSILDAAKKVDKLIVVLSATDRVRPGEFPLSGEAAKTYIEKYIAPTLQSKNIELVFNNQPVRYIYEDIDSKQKDKSLSFYLFAGPEDIADRFSKASLAKYFPKLVATGRIQAIPLREIKLGTEDRVSGTLIRKLLEKRDLVNLAKLLPNIPAVQDNIGAIADLFINAASIITKAIQADKEKKMAKKKSTKLEDLIAESVVAKLAECGDEWDMEHHGHENHQEFGMVEANLRKLAAYSKATLEMLHQHGDIDEWVQEKIAIAAEDIETIFGYMKFYPKHERDWE